MPNDRRPRLLVLGSRGQVGWELVRTLSPLGEVLALDRAALDLTDLSAIRETVRRTAPDVIVNAAAHTEVDRAESEADLARLVNAEAPAVLAVEAKQADALLVHFSTDYVFSGDARTPYREEDETNPTTEYGRSKLAGDRAVLGSGACNYVFRVGWVYGRRGKSFLGTMQRLFSECETVSVVDDQFGAPTWSRTIAEATALAAAQWLDARRRGCEAPAYGMYHMAAPDHTTWHGFASAIAFATGIHGRARPVVTPISAQDYPTIARRPVWSVLDSSQLRKVFGLLLPSWRLQLALCLDLPDPAARLGAAELW